MPLMPERNEQVSDWVIAAELSDLKRRKKKQVIVAGRTIALFLISDQIYALDDVCIHQQRSLSKGAVLHGHVVCPGHQWSFDPATGWSDVEQRCQPTYDVLLADGLIYVDPRPRVHEADAALGSV